MSDDWEDGPEPENVVVVSGHFSPHSCPEVLVAGFDTMDYFLLDISGSHPGEPIIHISAHFLSVLQVVGWPKPSPTMSQPAFYCRTDNVAVYVRISNW